MAHDRVGEPRMPDTDICMQYLTNHLQPLCGRRLLPGVGALSACFEVVLTDSDSAPWRIAIENGRLVSVAHDGPEPACRFDVDSRTMLDIVSGQEPPQVAFFENRVDISGDLETGLVLSTVLEPFFRLYPYDPGLPDGQRHKDAKRPHDNA